MFSVEVTDLVSRTPLWDAPEDMQLTTATAPGRAKGNSWKTSLV
jgi:hypothetical protein